MKAGQPAGIRRRFCALFIDLPLTIIPTFVIAAFAVLALSPEDDYEPRGPHITGMEDFVPWPLIVLLLGSFLALFWSLGVSPGGWLFKLRYTSASGGPIAFSTALLRGILTALPVIAGLLLFTGGFA